MLAVALPTLGVTLWFWLGWGGSDVVRWADDLSLLIASGFAAFCCWRRPTAPAERRAWRLIAAGAAAWTAGQLVWTVHDLAFGGPPPMPYFDDIGYLSFPVLASMGLIVMPTAASSLRRWRWGIDGAIVALSACLLVFSPVIEPTVNTDAPVVTVVTSVAYPAIDVVLLVAVVLAAVYGSGAWARLSTVAGALALMAIADTTFAFLEVTGGYAPGAVCDAAYFAAFAVLAAATFVSPRAQRPKARPDMPVAVFVVLPYVPFTVAGCVMLARDLTGHPLDTADLVLGVAVTAAVLLRQALVLTDNRRLIATVRQQHAELIESATTDSLTGLANRAVFTDRAAHATLLHARDMRQVSVAWVDLDDFKLVNDTAGHAAGDQLLIKVADRLRGAVRMGDTLARIGGDEFAVLVEDGSDPTVLAERICEALRRPFRIEGVSHPVTASIGVTVLRPEDARVEPACLLNRADIAMYHAKNTGKDRVALYCDGMTVPGAGDAVLRDPLRRAVRHDDITLCYQPVVGATDGRVRGYEALARWTHDGKPVNPEEFVSAAERLGLGCELGDRILEHALAQSAIWLRERDDVLVGINLSPSQVLDAGLPERIAAALVRHDVPACRLVLEITEAALLTDSAQAVRTANVLAEMGIRLSLDDFGTGYSSLAHLRGLPLSSLKIDRAFVSTVDTDVRARSFIAAVIRLGQDLGLEVIVEGIETCGQLAVIRALGASGVQGYLVDVPRPADQVEIHRDWTQLFAGGSPELPRPRASGDPSAVLAGGASG